MGVFAMGVFTMGVFTIGVASGDSGAGTWTIIRSVWTGNGVSVGVTVAVAVVVTVIVGGSVDARVDAAKRCARASARTAAWTSVLYQVAQPPPIPNTATTSANVTRPRPVRRRVDMRWKNG